MGDDASHAPDAVNGPVLVDAAGAARMLDIGRTSFFGLVSAGRVPPAVLRAGRIVRWSVQELHAWAKSGCPPADAWKADKARP